MKPHSHSAIFSFSVGSPWEIWRANAQISSGRIIDIYTKSGGIGQYASQLILLPDFGVAISILVAGNSSNAVSTVATETVLQTLIPVLERMAIEQACQSICGTYASSAADLNSSIEITSDKNGLLIENWINQGVDMKGAIQYYASATGSPPIQSFRLQATNLQTESGNQTLEHRQVAYRASFEMVHTNTDHGLFIMDPNAHYWSSVDRSMYGEISVDDFVVHLNQTGTAIKIEPRVVRDSLHRIETES